MSLFYVQSVWVLCLCAIFITDIVPFEVQGLLYHNIHRKLHNADDLQLDYHLSLDAASYARTIARRLVVRHAPIQSRPGQGENIFLRLQSLQSWSVGLWSRERVVSGTFCFLAWCLLPEISWSMPHTKLFLNLVFKRPLIMLVAKPWHLLPMILLLARV